MVIQSEPNAYSQRWFTLFHGPIRDARTIAEVDFVCSFAPAPHFRRIADVCCGMGRHARELAKRGYLVRGVERGLNAVAKARELGGGPRYIQADLRNYQPEETAHDVIIIMGQSFGHFEAATNRAVLKRLASGVREHGRMVLTCGIQTFSYRTLENGISVYPTGLSTRENMFEAAVFLCSSLIRTARANILSGSFHSRTHGGNVEFTVVDASCLLHRF